MNSDISDALESHAAGLAALRRTDGDLAEMALANTQLEQELAAGRSGTKGDQRFHAAVLAAAASPELAALLERIPRRDDVAAAVSLRAHRLIYEAIVHRDRDEASWLMLEHIGADGVLARPDDLRGRAG